MPAELLKNMGDTGNSWFLELCLGFWNGGEIPDDWGKDLMCPIYKKRDKTACSNYRGISLIPHALKVYESTTKIKKRNIQHLSEYEMPSQDAGSWAGLVHSNVRRATRKCTLSTSIYSVHG